MLGTYKHLPPLKSAKPTPVLEIIPDKEKVSYNMIISVQYFIVVCGIVQSEPFAVWWELDVYGGVIW